MELRKHAEKNEECIDNFDDSDIGTEESKSSEEDAGDDLKQALNRVAEIERQARIGNDSEDEEDPVKVEARIIVVQGTFGENVGGDFYKLANNRTFRDLLKPPGEDQLMPVGDGFESKKGHGIGGKQGRELAADFGDEVRNKLLGVQTKRAEKGLN